MAGLDRRGVMPRGISDWPSSAIELLHEITMEAAATTMQAKVN